MAQIYLIIICVIWILASVRIIREGVRLVIYRLSKFFGFRGPGIVLTLLVLDKSRKIRIGETGIMTTGDMAEIDGIKIPVQGISTLYPTDPVIIDAFVNTGINTTVTAKKRYL